MDPMLSPLERSALTRVALGKGDCVPVHILFARRLAQRQLVRIVPPSERDYDSGSLKDGETWCVVTDHGRTLNAVFLECRS
jgi:hypothetical protein